VTGAGGGVTLDGAAAAGQRGGCLASTRDLGAAASLLMATGPDHVAGGQGPNAGGTGADVAIGAAGLPEVWVMTVRMVRKEGTVNLFVGSWSGTIFAIDTGWPRDGELTARGVYHHTPAHVETAFRLLGDGFVPAAPFISGSARSTG